MIWDPYQAAAEKQLSARTLVDGTGLVDNHQFYLATRPYANQHPQVITTLIDEVRSVGEWSQQNPQQVTDQVAPLLGLPADITFTAVKRQATAPSRSPRTLLPRSRKSPTPSPT